MTEYIVVINTTGGTSIWNVTTARRELNPPAELVADPGTFPTERNPHGDYAELSEWLHNRGIKVFGPNYVTAGKWHGCRVRTNSSGTALIRTTQI